MILALGAPGGLSGGLHGWQQQGHQNANDGDDHQKFDESETIGLIMLFHDGCSLNRHFLFGLSLAPIQLRNATNSNRLRPQHVGRCKFFSRFPAHATGFGGSHARIMASKAFRRASAPLRLRASPRGKKGVRKRGRKGVRNRFSAFSVGPAVVRLIPSAADARLDRATPGKTKGGGSSFHWSRQPSSRRATILPQARSLGHKTANAVSSRHFRVHRGIGDSHQSPFIQRTSSPIAPPTGSAFSSTQFLGFSLSPRRVCDRRERELLLDTLSD